MLLIDIDMPKDCPYLLDAMLSLERNLFLVMTYRFGRAEADQIGVR